MEIFETEFVVSKDRDRKDTLFIDVSRELPEVGTDSQQYLKNMEKEK